MTMAPSGRNIPAQTGPERLVPNPRAPVFGGPSSLIEALAPVLRQISDRAAEIETARAFPSDLLAKITETGFFRMALDPRYGGAGFALQDALQVIEEIGKADASSAWSLMLAAESHLAWTRFPEPFLDEVYTGAEPPMTRAALTPRGTMTRVEGGYRLNGQWPLVSGSYPSDWFLVTGLVVDSEGRSQPNPDGAIEPILTAVPAADVEVLDTWHALGLRSTESHDIRFNDYFVPEGRTGYGSVLNKNSGPLGQIALGSALGTFHVGVVLGIARGMLDELSVGSRQRKTLYAPTRFLAQSHLFQHRFAAMEVRLAAARAYAISESRNLWERARLGEDITTPMNVRHRAMVAHIHQECLAIANDVFADAGTAVLFEGSSMQRRFRDMRAACQHVIASTDIFHGHGAFILEQELESWIRV